MKLYHSASSPNSRRVRMYIAEKGLSIPLQPVNLAEKEQFSDWFKAINPRGIGQATAIALANAGADVVVNYVSRPEAAEEVVNHIAAHGGSGSSTTFAHHSFGRNRHRLGHRLD